VNKTGFMMQTKFVTTVSCVRTRHLWLLYPGLLESSLLKLDSLFLCQLAVASRGGDGEGGPPWVTPSQGVTLGGKINEFLQVKG